MAGDDHGTWLTLAMIIFLTWSILFSSVRLWAKLRVKTAGYDDAAVILALVISVVEQVLMYIALSKGFGKPSAAVSPENLIAIDKYIYAAHFFYIIPMGLSRAASAFFIKQVAQHDGHSKPARIMAWVSTVWAVASLLVVAIRPPFLSPWLAIDGESTMLWRWILIESSGLVVEVALWALALHLVWSLQMQRSRRVFIIAAFGVRLLLIPIIAMRLVYLAPSKNKDPNQTTIIAAILTSGSLQFSIIASSVTALKPFLTVFNQPMFAYNGGVGGRSADSSDPYYKLEMFRRVDRKVEVTDDSANWRPDHNSAQRSITAQPDKALMRSRSEGSPGAGSSRSYCGFANRPPKPANGSMVSEGGESADTDASDIMIIKRTTEVTVRYET